MQNTLNHLRPLPCRRGAFTLIELMIVIVIILVLLGVLIPAIGASRRAAGAAGSFSNLRQLGAIMIAYTRDSREKYLNPFRPEWPTEPSTGNAHQWTEVVSTANPALWWDFESTCWELRTEGFASYWYSYLAEYRGGGRMDAEAFSPLNAGLNDLAHDRRTEPAMADGLYLWGTDYAYSPTFWCKPERYIPTIREDMAPRWLQTNGTESVAQPSAKVLLWESSDYTRTYRDVGGGTRSNTYLASGDPRSHPRVFLADGSADTVDMSALYLRISDLANTSNFDLMPAGGGGAGAGGPLKPCVHGEGPWQHVDGSPGFFACTRFGVKGRDLAR